jgi:hypothetical protein
MTDLLTQLRTTRRDLVMRLAEHQDLARVLPDVGYHGSPTPEQLRTTGDDHFPPTLGRVA